MTEIVCFDFRLVELPDGNQLINDKVKTPVDALTPEMQVEYMEVYNSIAFSERMAREARRQEEQQRKNPHGLLYKAACLIGLI